MPSSARALLEMGSNSASDDPLAVFALAEPSGASNFRLSDG
jgi:hypothetical protein